MIDKAAETRPARRGKCTLDMTHPNLACSARRAESVLDTAREDVAKMTARTSARNRDDVKNDSSSHIIVGCRRMCMAGWRPGTAASASIGPVKLRKHLLLTFNPTNCKSHSYRTLKTRSLPITYIHTRLQNSNTVRSSTNLNGPPPRKNIGSRYPRGQQFHR
jgi:hypothetical protein